MRARTWNGGKPPATIRYGSTDVPNFFKDRPRRPFWASSRKSGFWIACNTSKATWKIWGNTTGTLDMRADPLNLPAGLSKPWPGAGYASFGGGDHSGAFVERAEIYDFVSDHKITGFATVAGDRHSFWAGYAAKSLAARRNFEPVGIAFITGSISAPGMVEAHRAFLPERSSASAAIPCSGPSGRPSSTYRQSSSSSRSEIVHGVSAEWRDSKSSRVIKSRIVAPSSFRRYGRARICSRAGNQ